MITVVGNVADSPRFVRTQNGSVTNFRLASTARRYDAGSQSFVDSTTFWIDVECWNDMSSNVSGSVSKGDPVIVQGLISTHSWDSDAGRRSRPQIKAVAVGHNLARGTAAFVKKKRVAVPAEVREPGDDLDGPADLADEAYAEGVDPFTGEVIERDDGAAREGEGILPGRDYVVGDGTLDGKTADGRSLEPAHA
jgi:single-strand DNA-binding protein